VFFVNRVLPEESLDEGLLDVVDGLGVVAVEVELKKKEKEREEKIYRVR
jgi:hypothetical protein